MATDFCLPAKQHIDTFKDSVSVDDIVTYRFDCSVWEEDNSTITGATLTNEAGDVVLGTPSIASGVVTFTVTYSNAGKTLIAILLTTASQRKKLWLEVSVKDLNGYCDDYGIND